VSGELELTGAERVAPIPRRSIDDRASLHVNAIGQLLIALDAPRIGMTGANFRLAFRALADYRWRFFHGRISRRGIHNDKRQTFAAELMLITQDAPYIILTDSVQVCLG